MQGKDHEGILCPCWRPSDRAKEQVRGISNLDQNHWSGNKRGKGNNMYFSFGF